MGNIDFKNIKCAVVGPGAIGGLLACQFHKLGINVTCIGADATVARLKAQGLSLASQHLGNYKFFPAAALNLDEPVDFTFLTVKGPFLKSACKRLVPGSLVIPLLNGLGVASYIRQVIDCRIAIGTIGRVEAFRSDDGIIHHTTPGATIDICGKRLSKKEMQMLSSISVAAGFTVNFHTSDEKVVWGKLSRLGPLSLVTAASGLSLGDCLHSAHWRAVLKRCVHEVAVVASQDGVQIEPGVVLSQLYSLPATLQTSLQRDVEAGRPNELSLIADGILLKGQDFGVQLPTVRALKSLILDRIETSIGRA